MDYKYIEQLIERYWNCETSIEEEQILRSFFLQHDVPENLRQYADVFTFASDEKKEKLSADFDQRILSIVERREVRARIVPLTSRFSTFFKAAAVVAMILTIGQAAETAMADKNTEEAEIVTGPSLSDNYVRKDDIPNIINVIDHSQAEVITSLDSVNVTINN